MRATHTRLVLVTLLSLSLGACSAILPNRASEPGAAQASSAPPAKPSVVVLLKGPRSARVRKRVENMLAKNYEIVPAKQYRKAARRLKARKMSKRHVARVASKLGADAVLHGILTRRGKKRFKLRLRLREGATGKTLERFAMTLRSRKLRKRARRKLAARLRPALDELSVSQQQEVVAEAEPEEPARSKKADKRSKKANDKRRKRADQRVAEAELDDAPAYVERVTDDGQVIDDEVPDILR